MNWANCLSETFAKYCLKYQYVGPQFDIRKLTVQIFW